MRKDYQKNRRQWLLRGGSGAALTGFGISYITSVTILKYEGATFWNWFSQGTLALILFIAGLCLMIDAVRFRIRMDQD
ncbi:MAG: hypothetical protein ACI93L_002463 [Cyclobacteriaceae bacterium]|jgi:hypothetical protein